jgi:hypothetical protein
MGFSFWIGFQFLSGNWNYNDQAGLYASIRDNLNKSDKIEIEDKKVDIKAEPKEEPQEVKVETEENKFRASTWFSDYSAMIKNIQYYNEVHPFIYTMKGGLVNTGDLISTWSKEKRRERIQEMRKAKPGILIIPTIFRWENPKEKISENIGMNGRSDIREKHINEIINEVETYEYDGIDIDYEGMTCNKKEKFEEFIVLLSKELKKRGKLLSVALHPKTASSQIKNVKCTGLDKPILQDFAENWRGPMTHDYKFLARYADRIKIMAYELHPRKYRNPGPGPQAPNVWLKAIIEYAMERVPSDKLYMAIPTYGYDWALNCKARAKAVYWDTAVKIQSNTHKMYQPTNITKIIEEHPNSKTWKNLTKFSYIHENKIYEDPSLWYRSEGCDRVAFFMNKKAFEEKMTLLRKYDLAGFSFWQLLTENDPSINDYLSLLMTNKLPRVKTVAEEKEEQRIRDLEKEKIRLAAEKKSIEEKNNQIPSNKN